MNIEMSIDMLDYIAKESHGGNAMGCVGRFLVGAREMENNPPEGYKKYLIAGTIITKTDENLTFDRFHELWDCNVIIIPKNKYTENLSRTETEGVEPLPRPPHTNHGALSVNESLESGGLNPQAYPFIHFEDGKSIPLKLNPERYVHAFYFQTLLFRNHRY